MIILILLFFGIFDGKFIVNDSGHTGLVSRIEMCPVDDSFMSCGEDATVRFWDLRSNQCEAKVMAGDRKCSAVFDPEGVVMAVYSFGKIRLFDRRKKEDVLKTNFLFFYCRVLLPLLKLVVKKAL